jgi:hypothetical protein
LLWEQRARQDRLGVRSDRRGERCCLVWFVVGAAEMQGLTEIHRKSGLIDRNVAWCRPARIDSRYDGRHMYLFVLQKYATVVDKTEFVFLRATNHYDFFGQHECSPDRIDSFPRGAKTTTAIDMPVRSSSCPSSPSRTSPKLLSGCGNTRVETVLFGQTLPRTVDPEESGRSERYER